jgi:hypothetical protein
VVGSCEHGEEPLDSISVENFLNDLRSDFVIVQENNA